MLEQYVEVLDLHNEGLTIQRQLWLPFYWKQNPIPGYRASKHYVMYKGTHFLHQFVQRPATLVIYSHQVYQIACEERRNGEKTAQILYAPGSLVI